MSIAASLDLGSNTLRLLVAQVDCGPDGALNYRALHRALATPRLGRGLRKGWRLSGESKEAATRDAAIFAHNARELGAEVVALAATQACRLAADGREFVDFLARELGLDRAWVLSGEQEAELSRQGVLSRLRGETRGALLADVGGGSTEMAPLDPPGSSGEGFRLSLPLGAVSLAEAHLLNDPPSREDLDNLRKAVEQGLGGLEPAALEAGRLVATAGTAATCANMKLGLIEYEPERINNLSISKADLVAQFEALAALPLAQRRRTRGLEPERADIILAGIAILHGLLDQLKLNVLTVMDAGLLEGILLEAARIAVKGE